MELPKRKSNRLPYFDHSTNAGYFVTICTEHRKNTLCVPYVRKNHRLV